MLTILLTFFVTPQVVAATGGSLHSARVARRAGPKGESLSAGFGFVEVDSPATATAVIKQLQVRVSLQLQL